MSILSWFSSSSSSATQLQNLTNVAQSAAAASGNPQAAAIANIASAILGGGNNGVAAASSNAGYPLGPTQAQIEAAMQALVAAQNAYNTLLAQQKAVAAYEAAMKAAQTEVVSANVIVSQPPVA